jgi:hypothetical protein
MSDREEMIGEGIAQKLNAGLDPTKPKSSVDETATWIELLRRELVCDQKFELVGYEDGVPLYLEVDE